MEDALNVISLEQLVSYYPILRTDDLATDFAITMQDVDDSGRFFLHPLRFDGYLIAYCVEGELAIDLNLQTYVIRENMIFVCEPGNIVLFHPTENASAKARFRVAAASTAFVREVDGDITCRYSVSREIHKEPCLLLPAPYSKVMIHYYDLAETLINSNLPGIKEALHFLASSSIFFLASFWEQKRKEVPEDVHTSRSQAIVDRYIGLVTEHHMQEHYLAFYAKELDITPKYLSKLVRDVTGRSAPDWIDSFLILEAKNMLKYSKMAIKEIVFKLHFPDQSSFYKFFKLHTGMIPSEYRKSR